MPNDDPASAWTPPSVDNPFATAPVPLDTDWQQIDSRGGTPGVGHLSSLPGVDLPTQLPPPQADGAPELTAHKPGVVALRPMGPLDVVSGAISAARGNVGIIVVAWLVIWLPAGTVAVLARLVDDKVGDVVTVVVAFVAPIVMTTAVAAPMCATAVGVPMSFGAGSAALRRRFGSRLLLVVAVVAILAAPALLAGLAIDVITRLAKMTPAVLLFPILWAVPVTLFLLLAAPLQMSQIVAAVEDAQLGASIRRALTLTGRGFGRLLVPLALEAIVISVIGFALLMTVGIRFHSTPTTILLTAVVVTPIVAGFAAIAYVDARIRQEAYDVTLLGFAA